MGHAPEKHIEQAARIAKVALQMYQAGNLSHAWAVDRFERALGHIDIYNAEKAKQR